MAASVLKGALISFMPTGALGVPSLPNVIVFQINPETITHAWTEPAAPPPPSNSAVEADPLAAVGVPGESFSFMLSLDAVQEMSDITQNPIAGGLAVASGVYPRLAALEMLQYPTGSISAGLLGQVSASISASGISLDASVTGTKKNVPASQVPVVLFVWGAQRILPVRVTALSTTEKRFDALLNPIQADVNITLRVLTPDELVASRGPMTSVARLAYTYTQGLRQVQAAANLGDSIATIIGMLPLPM